MSPEQMKNDSSQAEERKTPKGSPLAPGDIISWWLGASKLCIMWKESNYINVETGNCTTNWFCSDDIKKLDIKAVEIMEKFPEMS